MKVSVILPCLNEAETVGMCIDEVRNAFQKLGIDGEIIVVDNGSTDGSAEIAMKHGAKVVHEPREGYGNAYLRGFQEAKGDIIVMGDADGTYPFEKISEFVKPVLNGEADFVIGSRLKGNILPGAMPLSHRYIGNPFLTFILNLLFKTNISDAHCGMRAFGREAVQKMRLRTAGMEFASEMVIEAARKKLRITEIPIEYRPRVGGKPKMSSLGDGWRHLRFMLLYKPTALFLAPGIFAFTVGLAALLLLSARLHSMLLGSLLMLVGFQIITLGLYSKIYSVLHGMDEPDKVTRFFLKYNSLEYEILLGTITFLIGAGIGLKILITWVRAGFGELSEIRNAILSSTFAIIGIQMVFAAVFLSMLLLEKKEEA